MTDLVCPKCENPRIPGAADCPACGIIFARWIPPRIQKKPSEILVTTGDAPKPYLILGPLYTYVTDKDGMLTKLAGQYGLEPGKVDLNRALVDIFVFGSADVSYQRFPAAFAVCVETLKRMCVKANGDAVIHLRQDVDISSALAGNKNLFMQAYGTAVRFESS